MNTFDFLFWIQTLIIGGFIGAVITVKIGIRMEEKLQHMPPPPPPYPNFVYDRRTSEYPEPITDFQDTMQRGTHFIAKQ